MTAPKDTGGAAFPILRDWRRLPDFVTEEGMTLRDHFAGLALITATGTPKQIAKLAYEIADEMLEARK